MGAIATPPPPSRSRSSSSADLLHQTPNLPGSATCLDSSSANPRLCAPVLPRAGSMMAVGSMAVEVPERKSVVEGKSVSVRVDLGGRRIIKKKIKQKLTKCRDH